jgi:predicted lipoprotein with Yx(FWY)xxD motif
MKLNFLILGLALSSNAWTAGLDPLTTVVIGGKEVFANASHLTIYVYDKDTGSTSNCYQACARAWPPVLLPPNTQVQAPLGVTQRTDGTTQITVNGKPVYTYVGDGNPGEDNGDGLGGIWHIIPTGS